MPAQKHMPTIALGDRIIFYGYNEKSRFHGREGVVDKFCGITFDEYCYVRFFKRGREKSDKTEMVLIEHLTKIEDSLMDTQNQPPTAMMTVEEATAKHNVLKNLEDVTRSLLLEMRDRQGWKALGYKSFVDYGVECFGYSSATCYRLAKAAEMQDNFDYPIGEIPETHLRPLASVQPELRQQVFNLARDYAKKHNIDMTAGIVKMTVDEYERQIAENEKSLKTKENIIDALKKSKSELEQNIDAISIKEAEKIAAKKMLDMEQALQQRVDEVAHDYQAKIDDQTDTISRLRGQLASAQQNKESAHHIEELKAEIENKQREINSLIMQQKADAAGLEIDKELDAKYNKIADEMLETWQQLTIRLSELCPIIHNKHHPALSNKTKNKLYLLSQFLEDTMLGVKFLATGEIKDIGL